MLGADNRLSLAASAIYAFRAVQFQDYDMDGSGELGDKIAESHHRGEVSTLARHGYTPKQYNDELRSRLAPDYPKMSHRIYALLCELEVDPEWEAHNTSVCTLGYPGHPGAEYSTLAYLKGE